MALSNEWSEWWRRFLGTGPDENSEAAADILRRRYAKGVQQTDRFKQHAQKMHYPPISRQASRNGGGKE